MMIDTAAKKRGKWKQVMTLGLIVLFMSVRRKDILRPVARPFQTAISTSHPSTESSSKNAETTESSTNHCWRHCPRRINKIYFSHASAGLGDRSVVMQMLGNMAGYLCAIVEVPPPSLLLSPIHNGGRKLDKRVEWKDFFNYTFLQDGSQVLFEAKDNPNFPRGFKNWRIPGVYNRKKYPGWQLVVTKVKGGSIVNDYRNVQELSWSQSNNTNKGFIWEIHRSIYGSRLVKVAPLPEPSNELQQRLQDSYNGSMRPFMKSWSRSLQQKAESCNYVNRANQPDLLRNLKQELQDRVRSMAPTNTSVFGFFHIRRNDAKRECDTSMPKLRSFFHCSLNGTETTGRHITFLMGSDEKDSKYRQNVMAMANQYSHVSMLDADKIVMDFMQDMMKANRLPPWLMNNFYQFELMKAIGSDRRSFASIYLVQRRSSECPRCFRLMKEFPEVWV